MRLYRRPPISDDADVPRLEVTPVEGLAVARRGKTILAASTGAVLLAEGTYPDVVYFPTDHTDPSQHKPVGGHTRCPWKGEASYFDAAGAPSAAWTYYEADPRVEGIAGLIAYDRRYVDVDITALPAVPTEAQDVLTFWFDETPAELHFKQDTAFDETVRQRFGALFAQATSGALDDWMATPKGGLALIILLDQFSRNLHRGDGAAFAQDEKAQGLADKMIAAGHDLALTPEYRAFAYLPFMHAEDIGHQNRSVALFTARLPGSSNVPFALGHRDTFHRHGRFPGRDAALGRAAGGTVDGGSD